MMKENMTRSSAERAAFLGMFTALSMILSYVESLIPLYFGAPGIKLGLANLFVLIMLTGRHTKEALVVNLARILLTGFLFGNLYSIAYSLAGALISMAVMYAMHRFGGFHTLSVSAAGGIAHNVGQFLISLLLLGVHAMIFYLPALMLAGLLAGIVIGMLAAVLKPYLTRLSMF